MRFSGRVTGHKHARPILRALFLLWSRPTSLTDGDAWCVGEFRTTFRTIPRLREAGAKFQTPMLMG
jgi:hypothetical protein